MEEQNTFSVMDDGPLLNILSNLNSPHDLSRSFSACHRLRCAGIEGELWKKLCLKLSPSMSSVVAVINRLHDARSDSRTEDLPNLDMKTSTLYSNNMKTLQCQKISSALFCQLAWELTKPAVPRSCIRRALRASSTDNFPEEAIEKTLQPSSKWPNSSTPSYWSSKGRADQKEPETLTYELESPVCIVHEVLVRPFQAYFQPGEPIYSSRAVKFRFGYRNSMPGQTTSAFPLTSGRILDMLEFEPDESYTWTYESPEYLMEKLDVLQRFKLPHPVLCVGGILQIELIDRMQTQHFDDLYYICICHVKAVGRPLPQFDFQLNSNTQKIMLRLNDRPQGTGNGQSAGVVNRERGRRFYSQETGEVAAELEWLVREIRDRAAVDDVALDLMNWLRMTAEFLPPTEILLRVLQTVTQPLGRGPDRLSERNVEEE